MCGCGSTSSSSSAEASPPTAMPKKFIVPTKPLIVKGVLTKERAHQLAGSGNLMISAILDPDRAQAVLVASNDKTKQASVLAVGHEADVRPYLKGSGTSSGSCADPQTKPFMICMIVFLLLMVLGWLLFGLKMGKVI